MEKSTYIKDFNVGKRVKDCFLLKSFSPGEARNGKPYVRLEFGDCTGVVKGVKWDAGADVVRKLHEGKIYTVDAVVREYKQDIQLNVDAIYAYDKSDIDYACFLPSSKFDVDIMVKKIFDIIGTIDDMDLKKLVLAFKNDEEFIGMLKQAPAAKVFHHAYVGGLSEHILSCLEVGVLLSNHYSQLDRNVLLMGIFLHDLGKIYELEYHHSFNYSESGKLVGHIVLGCELLDRKIYGIKEFPQGLALKLKHMVLSHHGEFEYGSPVIPKTVEALVLHHIDNVDAKINMFDFALEKGYNAQDGWVFSRSLGRYISVANPCNVQQNASL
ncbi:HD domain-containing protein [PVC group bacterium]|nr:HD domain-containing protein [PVC group bacterium]